MKWLLDTSVYSQPLRRKRVQAVVERWSQLDEKQICICGVVVAETEWGLRWEDNEQRWARYEKLLKGRLSIIETDAKVWERFGVMKARQRHLGETVGDLDLIIAAVAIENGLIVATLNTADFSRIEGVALEDWSR